MGIYIKLNIQYPILIFVTLVNVKGYRMGLESSFGSHKHNYVIDKNILANPEIVLEEYPEKLGNELKPVFDAIRNACGFKESRSYDNEGNWIY